MHFNLYKVSIYFMGSNYRNTENSITEYWLTSISRKKTGKKILLTSRRTADMLPLRHQRYANFFAQPSLFPRMPREFYADKVHVGLPCEQGASPLSQSQPTQGRASASGSDHLSVPSICLSDVCLGTSFQAHFFTQLHVTGSSPVSAREGQDQ